MRDSLDIGCELCGLIAQFLQAREGFRAETEGFCWNSSMAIARRAIRWAMSSCRSLAIRVRSRSCTSISFRLIGKRLLRHPAIGHIDARSYYRQRCHRD